MDGQLKQRIVGAVVLVAVAVIAIPMFLDGGSYAPPPAPSRDIAPMPPDLAPPAAPALPPDVAAEIDRGLDADASELAESLPDDTVGAAEIPPAPSPSAPEPVASAPAAPPASRDDWVVQLGSFSSKDNATALVDKLKGRDFHAFVLPLAGSGRQPAYRVRVGPTATRQEAERLHARLTMEFSIQGMVMRGE